MQATDPYLFYLYEFRRYALVAQVFVIIGYGFNDAHINDLLKQSLEAKELRRLLIVNPAYNDAKDVDKKLALLKSKEMAAQITVVKKGAKDFLTSDLTVDYVSGLLPKVDLPF